MIRKLLVPVIILLTGCAHRHAPPFEPARSFPADTLTADFDLMRSALEDAHPGLYDFTSEPEMDAFFDSMRAELNHDMTEPEFLRLIAPLNGKIGCGHTAILPSVPMRRHISESAGIFPCDVRMADGRMHIYRCYAPDRQNLAGTEILAINGIQTPDLIRHLTEVLPTDGRNTTFPFVRIDTLMRYFYAAFIGMPRTFDVTVALPDADGATPQTVSLPAMSEAAIKTHPDYADPDSDETDPLTLDIRKDISTAVMTIRTFGESDAYMPFLADSFTKIRDAGIQNLILDLRGNGGGEDEYGAALAAYLLDKPFPYYRSLTARPARIDFRRYTDLTRSDLREMRGMVVQGEDGWMHVSPEHHPCLSEIEPREPGFRGRVRVLIDGGSFSATSEVAAILQQHKRAEFIGEETGGRCTGNNSGYMSVLTLPGTGIRVILPFLKYTLAVDAPAHPDRGVFPDYFVESSIDDEMNGIDRVMMEAEEIGKVEN